MFPLKNLKLNGLGKYILYAVIFIVVYNFLVLLLALMQKSSYHFNLGTDLLIPLVISALFLRIREKEDALEEIVKSDARDMDEE